MTQGSTAFVPREIDAARFPKTYAALGAGVREGVAPGFVLGFWLESEPDAYWAVATGARRLQPTTQPMTTQTVFDLASLTKVMATAVLAARFVERGWLTWDTSVAAIFPGYPHEKIQVRHLLSHTAGFIAWEPFWERLREKFAPTKLHEVPIPERQAEMREMILSVGPECPPGTRVLYSDVSSMLLGFMLEEVARQPFDEAVRQHVWDAAGLDALSFFPVDQSASQAVRENVAATEYSEWRGGLLQGQVHDDNCWAMGGVAGHAGVFGRVEDVLRFARALRQGFLGHEILETMWARAAEPAGCERTLGWDTPSRDGSSVGRHFFPGTVGHLGFTGTSLWIDRSAKLAVTLLSNRVHPSRENALIRVFRPRLHDAVREDLAAAGLAPMCEL